MSLRLIFMGTPDFAVPTLRALRDHGHKIVAVYTRAPKPGGRGMILQPSPVEVEARQFNIPVLTPATLKTPEAEAIFRSHEADAAVVVAYGMILPQAILGTPRLGCFNLHGSLLPRWRGAAPIERAIMEGDRETGVMVMKMDTGLDTGDIALAAPVLIDDRMISGELRRLLGGIGAELMVQAMDRLEHHQLNLTRQSYFEEPYATKIDKTETQVDWRQPARKVLRHIHGLSPSPGAWCEMPIGKQLVRVRLLRCELAHGEDLPGELLDDRLTIACGQDAVRILELQKAGGEPMKAGAFLAGARLRPPTRLR